MSWQRRPRRGLTLTNYKAAMAGSIYGKVIIPGDPDKSYLVEMVSTGQMPKKGPDLTPEEIATIIAWINAGAPEAGSAIANSAPISGTVSMSDTAATGDGGQSITPETVSFADNVLPIFQDRCAECHGDNDPEEGLVLTSYKDVMLGSIYGAVVKPGDPDGSYLVEMVSTGQMPKKGADLTQSQIATIVAWINAGAPDN
ncbi:MAG: c-type cytochrome domain-containing protein [Caldilineaceae bacterium]